MPIRCGQIRSIGECLLAQNLSAERPIAILSGNDLDHALLGLAANYIGMPYVPISPAYSLISQDFGKLRHIFNLHDPRPRLCRRRQYLRQGDRGGGAAGCHGRCRAQPASQPADDIVPGIDGGGGERGGRCRPWQGRSRHHREIPLHVRLDRDAEGRDQHAAHVVREPGNAAHRARFLSGRAAGDRRLGALASHRRRQSRCRLHHLQWRHALYRRRQAAAGRDRDHGEEPARGRDHLVFHRAEGLRGARSLSPRRCRIAQNLLQPIEGAVVRRRGVVAIGVRRDEEACRRDLRRTHSVSHRPRLDGNGALRARAHVGEQGLRRIWDCRRPAWI